VTAEFEYQETKVFQPLTVKISRTTYESLRTAIDVLDFIERDCGADAFGVDRGALVAMKWDGGSQYIVRRYEVESR
jgi:hypothetical protein